MGSRRDDESVVITTLRRSNEESAHYSVSSCGAGEFSPASLLLFAHVPIGTLRSSRRESVFKIRSAKFVIFVR
ncbi:MAG: hypothetical protein AAB617_02120 [Patescibacteria group bacterium]